MQQAFRHSRQAARHVARLLAQRVPRLGLHLAAVAVVLLGGCLRLAELSRLSYADPNRPVLCVRYETQSGWSKGYQLEAHVIKGDDLNRRTNTWNYESWSTYVVVFWGPRQASIIKLDFYSGSIPSYGTQGEDKAGRKWEVSRTNLCY